MPMAGDDTVPNSRGSLSRVPQGSLAISTRDACPYDGTKSSGQRITTRIRYCQVNRQARNRAGRASQPTTSSNRSVTTHDWCFPASPSVSSKYATAKPSWEVSVSVKLPLLMAASLMAVPPLVHAIKCLTKRTSTPLIISLARAGASLLWTVSLRGMESPEEYVAPDGKHSYCFVSIAIGVDPTGGVTCLDCCRCCFCLSHRTSVHGPHRGQ